MDETDILLMAERDMPAALVAAEGLGYFRLLAELQGARVPRDNIFAMLRDATITVSAAADVARVPRSTAAAAAIGRCNGAMTKYERDRLLKYLYGRRDALDDAIEACEGSKKQ